MKTAILITTLILVALTYRIFFKQKENTATPNPEPAKQEQIPQITKDTEPTDLTLQVLYYVTTHTHCLVALSNGNRIDTRAEPGEILEIGATYVRTKKHGLVYLKQLTPGLTLAAKRPASEAGLTLFPIEQLNASKK